MKTLIVIFCLLISFCSFTSDTSKDTIEVLYDSKPIDYKGGIKLERGKELVIVNKSGGKIYKTELTISLGQRPCYQTNYVNEQAAKPIPVSSFMNAACANAKAIMLTVNVSTIFYIPIIHE